jgi:hypothetical protein
MGKKRSSKMKNYELKKVKDSYSAEGYYYELTCKYGSANIFQEPEDENTTNYHAIIYTKYGNFIEEIDSFSLEFVADEAYESLKASLEKVHLFMQAEIKRNMNIINNLIARNQQNKDIIAELDNLIKERDAE